jgi:tetratricopeptide (TPR) repeat protein
MNNTRDKIEHAVELKKDEKFEEALEILNSLYVNEPTSIEIKKALIDLLLEYGAYLNDHWVEDFEKAAECFDKIVCLDEYHYRAWYNLGISYFNLGQTDKALEAYQRALKIKPDYEYVYYNIGLLYETQKEDLENAINYYQKALRLNENFTYALHALRDVQRKLESRQKQKSFPIDGESRLICNNCGNINRAGAKFCDNCGELIH